MTETAIEATGVSYSYPDSFTALEDVNLRIAKGERFAIIGSNGAGKTTLMMLLSALFPPSRGSIQVFGSAANEKNLSLIRKTVGLVFQDPDDQLFNPTVREDVAYGLSNLGLERKEVSKRVNEALRTMRLEELGDKPPHHLSAGQKKKAAMAAVLAMQPQILLLDEPTANLDPRSRSDLVSTVDKLCRDLNLTLIVATHDANFLPELVDKAIVLNRGRIVSQGSIRDIFSSPQILSEANLEPPIVARLFETVATRNKQAVFDRIPLTMDEALREIDRLVRGKTSLGGSSGSLETSGS